MVESPKNNGLELERPPISHDSVVKTLVHAGIIDDHCPKTSVESIIAEMTDYEPPLEVDHQAIPIVASRTVSS